MNVKDYLRQAYRLDQKINSGIEEVNRLRDMTTNISSLSWGEKVQGNRLTEPGYVRFIDKIMAMEQCINSEIDLLVDLKEQIRGVIDQVSDTDERMVLKYRYIHNYTWEQIGDVMNADSRTARRWHGSALTHVILPKNPIKI